jgi:hypothetical protein
VVVAILLSAAALIVALIGVGRQPVPTAPTSSSQTSGANPPADTAAVDRELCNAVGPLLRESAEDGKNFVNLGHTGTPERDAGITAYRAKVDDWVGRIQPILDAHTDPPRYLTRMLQQFIDITHSYADNIEPGAASEPDAAAWNSRVVAYGGPYSVCHELGITW